MFLVCNVGCFAARHEEISVWQVSVTKTITHLQFFGHLASILADESVQETAEWTFAEGTVQHPWDFSANLSDFEKAICGKRAFGKKS